MKDGKSQYRQFRNMVFNDAGVTREDMKQWIKEAVQEKVSSLVTDESIESVVKFMLRKWSLNSLEKISFEIVSGMKKQMKHELTESLKDKIGEILSEKIQITLKEK